LKRAAHLDLITISHFSYVLMQTITRPQFWILRWNGLFYEKAGFNLANIQ